MQRTLVHRSCRRFPIRSRRMKPRNQTHQLTQQHSHNHLHRNPIRPFHQNHPLDSRTRHVEHRSSTNPGNRLEPWQTPGMNSPLTTPSPASLYPTSMSKNQVNPPEPTGGQDSSKEPNTTTTVPNNTAPTASRKQTTTTLDQA